MVKFLAVEHGVARPGRGRPQTNSMIQKHLNSYLLSARAHVNIDIFSKNFREHLCLHVNFAPFYQPHNCLSGKNFTDWGYPVVTIGAGDLISSQISEPETLVHYWNTIFCQD